MTSTILAESERSRRWAIGLSLVLGLLLVVLPWQFWRDAISGGLYYVTPLGISGYALSAMCVAAVLYGLLSSRHRSTPPAWTLLPAIALVAVPLLKWTAIYIRGLESLEVFHNRMGLGQEIWGFIPNAVIDGVLALTSFGMLVALIMCCQATTVRPDGS